MKTKRKTILAIVLATGGIVVWLPQLFGSSGSETREERKEVSNERPSLLVSDRGETDAENGSAPSSRDPSEITSVLQRAEETASQTPRLALDDLLVSLVAPEEGESNLAGLQPDERLYLASATEELELTATLVGPEPLAIIGGRIVRVGDELDDRILVEEIAQGSVSLRCGDARMRLRLNPLTTRSQPPPDAGDTESETQENSPAPLPTVERGGA